MEKKILEKFPGKISKVFFEKEDGLMFLRVELNVTTLDEVTSLSREISSYLDEIDYSDKEYYLDVYSSGTEKVIDNNEIPNHINENVYVEFTKHIKDMDSVEGQLLEANPEHIIIRWNAKGQFRKLEVELSNIKLFRLSSKINKEKK